MERRRKGSFKIPPAIGEFSIQKRIKKLIVSLKSGRPMENGPVVTRLTSSRISLFRRAPSHDSSMFSRNACKVGLKKKQIKKNKTVWFIFANLSSGIVRYSPPSTEPLLLSTLGES